MYGWHKKTGKAYVTSGIGYGKTELSAFDAAELDANIMAANAIKVSSFIPPNWQIVHSKEELKKFTENGVFLPMAYAYAASNSYNVAASLFIGVNQDPTKASIIVEHAEVNCTTKQSLEQSTSCIEDAYCGRGWEISGLEKVAIEGAPRDGLYVCVLVAVVFLVDQPDNGVHST